MLWNEIDDPINFSFAVAGHEAGIYIWVVAPNPDFQCGNLRLVELAVNAFCEPIWNLESCDRRCRDNSASVANPRSTGASEKIDIDEALPFEAHCAGEDRGVAPNELVLVLGPVTNLRRKQAIIDKRGKRFHAIKGIAQRK